MWNVFLRKNLNIGVIMKKRAEIHTLLQPLDVESNSEGQQKSALLFKFKYILFSPNFFGNFLNKVQLGPLLFLC